MASFASKGNDPRHDEDFRQRLRGLVNFMRADAEFRTGIKDDTLSDDVRTLYKDRFADDPDLQSPITEGRFYMGVPLTNYVVPPATLATAQVEAERPRLVSFDDYENQVIQTESSGNFLARQRQKGQTASGLYGMTEPTFGLVQEGLIPDDSPYKNITFEQMQKDPDAQVVYGRALIHDDARRTANRGITPTAANLYIVHMLGLGDSGTLFRANDDDPIEDVLPASVLAANEATFNPRGIRRWGARVRTVGDYKQKIRNKMGDIADMEVDIYSGQSPQALASWR